MRTKLKKFTDEKIYQIVHEYLTTEISNPELMKKYNFGGPNTIYRWMKYLGITKENLEQIKQDRIMTTDPSKRSKELELEHKVRLLEEELKKEKLRSTALSTMIDIAERDLNIDIRKKRGAKQ